jgi:very-short-patch-repair endonuclease
MLHDDSKLKSNSRQLRCSLTDSEALMWFKLSQLVVELDGSQHFLSKQQAYDSKRELYLKAQGLTVIRFNNLQVLKETSGVLEVIYCIRALA